MQFTKHDSIYYYYNETMQIDSNDKLAMFDLDGTIITTKSGNPVAKHINDWKFLHSNVITKMKDINKSHKIIIITNQNGISKNLLTITDFTKKINNIFNKLEITPLLILVSTCKDYYRKPNVGMFKFIKNNIYQSISFNKKQSFYCGDAAGRTYETGEHDFSDSDMLFAKNNNIDFTPFNILNAGFY